MTRRVLAIVCALAAVLVGMPSATAAPPGRGVPLDQLSVGAEQVAFGLRRPVAIAGVPDGRLLIVEKQGTVRAYHPDTGLAAEPVLDLTDRVDNSDNERGLLGLAPAPDFATSNVLYVAYTSLPAGELTLSRVPLDAPDREQVLLTQEHEEYGNHNGGQVAFGRDGKLYWSLGDGGHAGDPFQAGQDLGTLLGKIVRIDVSRSCGALPYCVPGDNPFTHTPGARPEIWVYGLRNPWRFSIDPADNSLWIGDVGQGTREEVDHLRSWQGGANFGWSCREGTTVFDETRCDPAARYTDPVFDYRSSVEGCSVIGGMVYRGLEYASLAEGTYVFTDYCSSTVWALRPRTGTYESAVVGTFPTQVTAFGADARGEFYVVNDLPGGLHKVSFARVQR
jgi:glucose/arabinose dehydrogenase